MITGHGMRILIDNGSYGMQNHGDVSMLIVAVERLSKLWPNAEILVVTDRPLRLKRAIPKAIPVPSYGHLLGPLHGPCAAAEDRILRNYPRVALYIGKAFTKLRPNALRGRNLQDFTQIVSDADLVVASGGGYMTDDFAFYAMPILEVLEIGTRLGKTTAMLGQGLGPFQPGPLSEKAARVLPHLDRIHVREDRVSGDIFRKFRVPLDRTLCTGDDAVEFAYRRRPEGFGTGIGVNLRRTKYSQVERHVVDTLREVLRVSALKYDAKLIPLPISVSDNEADHRSIHNVIRGLKGAPSKPRRLKTPQDVVAELGNCRIVVTGAYHAAVFALSCGIPAVCLAKSEYYVDKLMGLADQFGTGCEVILLNQENLQEALLAAIDRAHRSAESVRPALLAAAERQIDAGHEAYHHIYQLTQSRRHVRYVSEKERPVAKVLETI